MYFDGFRALCQFCVNYELMQLGPHLVKSAVLVLTFAVPGVLLRRPENALDPAHVESLAEVAPGLLNLQIQPLQAADELHFKPDRHLQALRRPRDLLQALA